MSDWALTALRLSASVMALLEDSSRLPATSPLLAITGTAIQSFRKLVPAIMVRITSPNP